MLRWITERTEGHSSWGMPRRSRRPGTLLPSRILRRAIGGIVRTWIMFVVFKLLILFWPVVLMIVEPIFDFLTRLFDIPL